MVKTLFTAGLLTLAAVSLSIAAESAKTPVAAPAAFNNACRTCHSIKQGDHRIGPSLHRIFGAKAGARQGFQSSGAIKNSGVTWDNETLDRFIENPEAVAPGNAMKPYAGLPDQAARKQIIEYLKGASKG
jgi:cytochrome c